MHNNNSAHLLHFNGSKTQFKKQQEVLNGIIILLWNIFSSSFIHYLFVNLLTFTCDIQDSKSVCIYTSYFLENLREDEICCEET